MSEKERLKNSLLNLEYGKVAVLAMVERGVYADSEDRFDFKEEECAWKIQAKVVTDLAMEVKKADEDVLIIGRKEEEKALGQADFESFIAQLKGEKHLVFVECLSLGTTEIKGILNQLLEEKKFATTKLVLLDLPTIEYMTLRDAFHDVIAF